MAVVVNMRGFFLGGFGPHLCRIAKSFDVSNQRANIVKVRGSIRPGWEDVLEEKRMVQPQIFEAEEVGFGDVGGDGDDQRDVVRGWAGSGGE